MATVKELLLVARQAISNPENWTQYVIARDAEGVMIFPDSSKAVCWCSLGALRKAQEDLKADETTYVEAYDVLCDVLDGSIVAYNDTHTHAEVLALFDKAITNAN